MTIAEKIADVFFNDGMTFETPDGRRLDDVCREMGGQMEWHPEERDVYRWEFDDGSAIIVTLAGWSVEGTQKWVPEDLE